MHLAMDLTIIATFTAVAWIAKNQPQFPSRRQVLAKFQTYYDSVCRYLYHHVYLRYRSEISLSIGWLLHYARFTCTCCCLELGGQDLDTAYREACQCEDTADQQHCTLCIATYLEHQITGNRSSKLVCLGRKCMIDDRLVRKRLSSQTIKILDRNQIMDATASTTAVTKEKLWHCPSPDCDFAGFVSTSTDSRPPPAFSFRNLFLRKKRDARSITCPACLISSCQFCGKVWTRGTVGHEGITCDRYGKKLERSADDDSALSRWKRSADTQVCRSEHCNYVIEKNAGCIHMTCRCGYEFCWVCGEPWTDRHSYFCRRRPSNASRNNDGGNRATSWFGSWFN